MAKFNKLDVPHQWRDEFTKYPHGYTIFEALCKWVKQVDNMVDNINNWNGYLDNFVESFEFELQEEVQSTIERWKSEGLLDDIIENVLNTELDNVKAQLAENENDLEQRGINPIKYNGFMGDGTDSAKLQDVIDVASTNNLDVFIPNGDFLIDNLDIKCNLFGGGNTIIRCNNVTMTNKSNLVISGIHFITSENNLDGLDVTDCENIVIKECTFESFYVGEHIPLNVTFLRSNNTVFTNNKVVGGNLSFNSCRNIKVMDNLLDGRDMNKHDLLKCTSQTSGIVSGNTIINSTHDGIDIYTAGDRMVITNNHIENCKTNGIEAKVILRDPPYTGGSSDQSGFVESVIISNNIFRNIGGASGDSYSPIKNVYVDLRSTQTFEQKNTPRCFIITNNIIEDVNKNTTGSGHYAGIMTSAHNSIISNNIIRNVYRGGGGEQSGSGIILQHESADNIVEDNVISGAESCGIRTFSVSGTIIKGNVITNDKVSDMSSEYGIRATSLNSCSVSDNKIESVSERSIYVTNGCENTSFSNNDLSSGIMLSQSIKNIIVQGNHVSNKSIALGEKGFISELVSVINNHVKNTGTSAGARVRNIKGGIISDNIFDGVSFGALIEHNSTYILAKNNVTMNQLNSDAQGVRFNDVTTENQETSIIESNIVIT